ncbi:hypothetical protein GQ457_06G003200 [Hibiscus cannabinus]
MFMCRGEAEAAIVFPIGTNLDMIKTGWIWDQIREWKEKLHCHKIIWYSSHIPEHSIVSWMDISNRFSILKRLIRFRIVKNDDRLLCHENVNSRDYLFLGFYISNEVRKGLFKFFDLSRDPMEWKDKFEWAIAYLRRRPLIYII